MAGVGYVAPVIQPNYVNSSPATYSASNDNALLTAIEEAGLTSTLDDSDAVFGLNTNTSIADSFGTTINESLLSNVNAQALLALNDVANTNNSFNSSSANFGILNAAQLQDFATLQADIQFLVNSPEVNNSTEINTGLTINDNGTNINLSPEALDLLSEITAENSISTKNSLSPAQVQQVAQIVAPFLNQPLTPTVVNQIDTQLATAGFNPEQISLQNLFLTMNYVAAETEGAYPPDTLATNEMVTAMESEEA